MGGISRLALASVVALYSNYHPGAKGQWTETVLHAFSGKDGVTPIGTLVFDGAGNLYGATSYIGEQYGMVFKLSPGAEWTLTILHVFSGNTAEYPTGVTLDTAGNLYGTTAESNTGDGIVYELTAVSGGQSNFEILHIFNSSGKYGDSPQAAPILDAAGNLYGTTFWGGNLNNCANGCGVVFKITR